MKSTESATSSNDTEIKEITMTTETVDPTAETDPSADPSAPITCPTDRLPCRFCGIATPYSDSTVTYIAVVQYGPSGREASSRETPMSLCHDCAALEDRALTLALAHPVLVDRLGQSRGVEATTGVLIGLHLLGMPEPEPTCSDHELGALIRAIATLGLVARWRDRVSTAGTCMPSPWSAVEELAETRAAMRTAYAALLAERIAEKRPPVLLSPPPISPDDLGSIATTVVPVTDGCLLCGRATVEVPAVEVQRARSRTAAARTVWSRLETVSPTSLGAQPGPHSLTGWTCPSCTSVVESEGANLTATERALLEHLGLGGRWSANIMINGIVAYGALISDAHRPDAKPGTPGPTPGLQPWQHLGDLDDLRARLARDLGVSA